jgi:hypothetical protein cdifQCD-7_20227
LSITKCKKIIIVNYEFGGSIEMKVNLPEKNFFDSFYIWFNKEKREEYYSTPLYLYSVNRKDDFENRLLTLYFDKSEVKERTKEEQGLKYPGNMYFPYVERLGMFLLRFLNANLETYESAYETFFFAYGFEILKDIDEDYNFELKGKYANDEEYLKQMEKIYDYLQYKIQEVQAEMKAFVNYVFNLDEQEELKEYTPSQRFAVYLIKHKGQAHTYNRNDNIIQDSYSNKNLELSHLNDKQLLDSFKNNTMLVSMIDTHQSNDLSAICYAVLEELVKTTNNPIKKCQNCGMYFIPNSRLDEIYCDYPKANGKTCREQGAVQAYNERLKQNKALSEYRRLYQLKSMAVGRNRDNKQMKKDFDEWKKHAKERVNKLKHGILTEDEVYEWLKENKL